MNHIILSLLSEQCGDLEFTINKYHHDHWRRFDEKRYAEAWKQVRLELSEHQELVRNVPEQYNKYEWLNKLRNLGVLNTILRLRMCLKVQDLRLYEVSNNAFYWHNYMGDYINELNTIWCYNASLSKPIYNKIHDILYILRSGITHYNDVSYAHSYYSRFQGYNRNHEFIDNYNKKYGNPEHPSYHTTNKDCEYPYYRCQLNKHIKPTNEFLIGFGNPTEYIN